MVLRGFVLELTKKHGLSQTEIARRSGLSQPLIHKIISGLGAPQMRTHQKLALAFPEEWNEHLLCHPALDKELIQAFGWATKRSHLQTSEGEDPVALFERSLGLPQFSPLPKAAGERYRKRIRKIMRWATRELHKYQKTLEAEFGVGKAPRRARTRNRR